MTSPLLSETTPVTPTVPRPKIFTAPRILITCLLFVLIGIPALIFGTRLYTSIYTEHTARIPGNAIHFDPISSYVSVHAHAGSDAKLTKIEATSVRSDGTLDLMAEYIPSPRVTYTFYRVLDQAPPDAPPIGAGGGTDGRWYEPLNVQVYKPWDLRSVNRVDENGRSEYQYYNLGMERNTLDPVGAPPGDEILAPTCAFHELWKSALVMGAPAEAVATIVYDQDGYTFAIPGTPTKWAFDRDCRLRELP